MFIEMRDVIPGWNNYNSLTIIGEYASKVPETGWIVEYAPYCGRASYVLGKNKKHSTIFTCIGHVPDAPETVPPEAFGDTDQSYNLVTLIERMAGVKNFEHLNANLPLLPSYAKYTREVDLLYINNPYDSDVLIRELPELIDVISDGVILVNNAHYVERGIETLFPSDTWDVNLVETTTVTKIKRK